MKNIFIFYFLHRFIFFYAIFINFLKNHNLGPFQISVIIVAHEGIKIFTDSYTGAIADKYGARKIISIGLTIKAIGFIGWIFCDTFWQFCIFTLLIGFGRSCILGKIDVYVYNTLYALNKADQFKKILLQLSIVENISLILSGIVAGFLSKYANSNLLLIASAFIILAIHVPFALIVMKDSDLLHKPYKQKSLKSIIIQALNIVNSNHKLLYLILLVAMPFSLTLLLSDLYKMISADIGLNIKQIGSIYSLAHILPLICSIIFLFLPLLKFITINHVLNLMIFGMFMCGLSGILYGKISIFTIIGILGTLPICNIVLKNFLETNIPNEARYTITAFTSLISSLIIVINFTLIGILATYFSYKISIFIFVLIYLTLLLTIKRKIPFITNNLQ